MLDSLLTSTAQTTGLSLQAIVISLLAALVSGFAISQLYIHTNGQSHSSHLATTLVFLPAVLSVVIMLVGNNVATAFSLAGLFTIIRFRSAPGSSKDILFILFCVGAGLAYGLGLYGYGVLFTLVMAAVLASLTKTGYGTAAHQLQLKIVTPDDMNSQETFGRILGQHCSSFALERIGTKDLGSVYELVYAVSLNQDSGHKQLIDEIRRHNGNMNISLANRPSNYEF